jgi:hypothetical protein
MELGLRAGKAQEANWRTNVEEVATRMGLNVNNIKFLLLARRRGISFNRVLMIGRQSLTISAAEMRSLTRLPWLGAAAKQDLRRLRVAPGAYGEEFFRLCGAAKVDSIDKTDYEGATVLHDLNLPVPDALQNRYDLIFDGGSIEHIFNVPTALANYMKMLDVGGHYICNTATNNYSGHGFYQFSPEFFFAAFAPENGFILTDAFLYEENGGNAWYRLTPPASAERRLTFQNKVPAHLLILAKKIAATHVFEHAPQQRMYAAAWAAGAVPARETRTVRSLLFRCLHYLPPR